jgi:hypothetical protein
VVKLNNSGGDVLVRKVIGFTGCMEESCEM